EQISYRLHRSTDPNFTPSAATLVFDENSAVQPVFSGNNLVFTDTTAANCKTYYYRLQAVDNACITDVNFNDPASFDTASSSFYPPTGTASDLDGRAESDVAPAKVANVSVISDTCAGNSNVNCDVKIQWTPVTTDTATPAASIYVDEYRIATELQDPITLAWAPLGTPVTVSNGATQHTFTNLAKTNTYRFTVQARQCSISGAVSDYLYWPCDFTPTVTLSVPVSYGGTGTAAAPYIINSPATVDVTISAAVAKIEVWSSAGGAIQKQEGNLTSASFAIPDPPDDTVTAIYVNTVLASGCAKLSVFYVEDQAPPPCPTGVITASLTNNQVTLTLANSSTVHNLTLQKIKVTWNSAEAPNNTNLSGLTVENVASTQVSESHNNATNLWTEIWTPPAGAIINATETGFPIQLTFNLPGNQKLSVNPVKSICVQYKGQQNDVIVCGFTLPGSVPGTCTIP
ncbi:MAG TPA: fibronectin type III domain-containing protein, partial [Thermoanaerobaculia bacterium]|nr:fibronectin type III domain-containing protein [Thermoanaerobaculia bacterium]